MTEKTNPKLPPIGELRALFIALKPSIMNDYVPEEGGPPGFDVTIGWKESGDWSYQTGDNSYMGSAYHYPHWAVVWLTRRANSTELAREVRSQLSDLYWQ